MEPKTKPMKAMQRVLAWIAFTSITASACHSLNASGRGVSDPVLDVRVGRSVTVSLASNPSTGYGWAWTNRADVRHVDTTGRSFDSEKPGVPGAGGRERWTFKGLSKGSDTVRLEYRRPWEKVAPVMDTTIVIRVR
jgi:inhibitor of cysteine peptidase